MKQLLSILAILTFTLGSSLKADVGLSDGMDTMARKLYHELAELPLENLLISPLSIFSAMGLLQRGAPKGSRTQLQLHIATMGRFVSIHGENIVDTFSAVGKGMDWMHCQRCYKIMRALKPPLKCQKGLRPTKPH